MKVFLLINSNSRMVTSGRFDVERAASILGGRVIIRITERIAGIEGVVEECYLKRADIVFMATGDGGLHRFISCFINTYRTLNSLGGESIPLPVFAPISSGTANLVTKVLGIKGKGERLFLKIKGFIEKIEEREHISTVRRKVLQVWDGITEKYGFTFGNGGVFNFFREYYMDGRYSIWRFLKISLFSILSILFRRGYIDRLLEPLRGNVYINGRLKLLDEIKFAITTSIEARLLFFKIFKGIGKKEELLFLGGNPSPFRILPNIPKLLMNLNIRGKTIFQEEARQVIIDLLEERGYTIDGELYAARLLHITPGPFIEFARLL